MKYTISNIKYLQVEKPVTRKFNGKFITEALSYSYPKEFVFETNKSEFDMADFYEFCSKQNIAYIDDCDVVEA